MRAVEEKKNPSLSSSIKKVSPAMGSSEMRGMEGRRWEDLTFDCLVCIFSKLSLEDLTLGVALVCKSFHEASLDPECWKILDFQDLDFAADSKFVARFEQEYRVPSFSFNSLFKLSIARSHGSAIKLSIPPMLGSLLLPDLILASIECPRLKVLALPTLLYQDDKKIPGLIRKWKELEKLEMTWKPNSFLETVEEIRANCPKFTGLRLCGNFDVKDAKAIVRCLPALKSLAVSGSFLRREDLVVILDGCGELREVDVSRCRGFDGEDETVKRASARIKKFVSDGCKVEKDYLNNYCSYSNLLLAMLFGDQ